MSISLMNNHYALQVASIEDSVEYLSSEFPFEFRAPALMPFEIAGHGERYNHEIRACYSVDFSLELVEASDRGPFAAANGAGIHHYGGPVQDFDAAIAAQRERGNEPEWELSYEGRLMAVYFSGTEAAPGRLELVDADAPPLLDLYAETS